MELDDLKQSDLARYLAQPHDSHSTGILCDKSRNDDQAVSIETFNFTSQSWPKESTPQEGKQWRHKLVMYRPDVISTSKALLFVNGGTLNQVMTEDNPQVQILNFARLAERCKALVIDLQNVPNQYLTFEDNLPRKGDRLYAYSWSRFLKDPEKNADWPLSLPMTKSIIKAMDVVQNWMSREYFIPIDHFVVSGLSKRGLATWLAALHDERIAAIVPMVIDTLNTHETMKHIYACYNHNWPQAFTDFIKEKIPESMESQAFERLMAIEDPLAYLQGAHSQFYKKRLSIPKYLISASGDDFFTPDSLELYLDQLPGETLLRFLPNQGHYIDLSLVEEILLSYFRGFIKRSVMPRVQWRVTQSGVICHVMTDKKPQSVKIWEAENQKALDFRLASGINYYDKNVVGVYRQGFYHFPIQVNLPTQGFKAHFIEIHFPEKEWDSIVLTTPAYVVGG